MYRHRCTHVCRDTSVGIVDTVAHRWVGTPVLVYTQVHTPIDRDTSVGIDTDVHTDRKGQYCGYRCRCTHR